MTAGGGSKDFFVSYSGADQAWAEWIAWILEEAGYTVVLQAWDFRDSNFVLAMQQAAEQAERMIAVLSPDYLPSHFTASEAARFVQDATGQHDLLIPVQIRPCEPEGLFARIVYVDLVGCDEAAAKRRLLDGVSGIRKKPGEPPSYPSSRAGHRVVPKPPNIFPGVHEPPQTGLKVQLESLPTALVEAIAARQVEDEDILKTAPQGMSDAATAEDWSGSTLGARSTVLKVLVFAATATLIAIGLGVVGAKVLLFFNTTRKAKPKGGGEGSTATYPADCSVFAPPALPAGGTIMLQVFLHPPELGEAAKKAARLFDMTAAPRGFTSLSLELKKGARVGFQLQVPDLCISDDGLGEVSWQNRVAGVQFLVQAPADCHPGARTATLRVFVEGIPAGRIHFLIGVESTACVRDAQPRGDVARNYRKAFISYASEDRTEVLKRVQTLSALGVAFFQDVLDLEPGQRWEKALYLQIDGSDLFLLFWSSAARRSSWVRKEILYALERQKQDSHGAPDIVPVIIEGPPPPLPPPELAEIHFNDKLIYFMRC